MGRVSGSICRYLRAGRTAGLVELRVRQLPTLSNLHPLPNGGGSEVYRIMFPSLLEARMSNGQEEG
jgi:hypothetical protein